MSARPGQLVGERNGNWRGGRTVNEDGYVLIRVGRGHPLADVRGYAYEHRLVMSEKLGRLVLPSELVHHKDENPANNSPDNLEIKQGNAEHYVAHRKPGSKLRMPGAPNEHVACACGCGAAFLKYDSEGRPRRFVSGHNGHGGF